MYKQEDTLIIIINNAYLFLIKKNFLQNIAYNIMTCDILFVDRNILYLTITRNITYTFNQNNLLL